MIDRLMCRLGSLPVLLALAVLTLAPLVLSFFAPSIGVPPWLGVPFAGAFGMGGAARDLGLCAPPPRRADPLAIAVLEYELFGIEPRPRSAAAFAVGARRLSGALTSERLSEKGGHASTAATVHDLPPLPAWLTRPPD